MVAPLVAAGARVAAQGAARGAAARGAAGRGAQAGARARTAPRKTGDVSRARSAEAVEEEFPRQAEHFKRNTAESRVSQQGSEERPQRITLITAGMMLALSLTFDAIQALVSLAPGIGQALSIIISVAAVTSFGIWFAIKGVNFFSGRKAGIKVASILGASVVELIPFIQAIPGITLSVFLVIWATYKEDQEGDTA